jgi:hypothetical protein
LVWYWRGGIGDWALSVACFLVAVFLSENLYLSGLPALSKLRDYLVRASFLSTPS